jgi:PAS domain S-box-containing protein
MNTHLKQGRSICDMGCEAPVKGKKSRNSGINGVNGWLAAFDEISELICINDKEFRIVRANMALAEALHTRPEALVGKYCYEVICGDEQPCTECLQRKTLNTTKGRSSKVFLPRLGFYADISAWPLCETGEESDKTLHIIRKIRQHKEIDINPAQDGFWFRKLANSLPCPAFEMDLAGKLIYANDVFMSVTGYLPEDLKAGLDILRLVDRNQIKGLQDDITAGIAGIHKGRTEYTIISKTNKDIPVEIFAGMIRDADNKPIGLRGIALDITERKRNEELMLQNAQELDRVFNTATGAMCIINKDYSIQRMNNEFAATFGIDSAGSAGRKCHEVLQHVCCNKIQCPMGLVLGGAKRVEQEIEAATIKTENANFHLTVVPYCGSNGEVLGLVANFRDITDMKTVQKQLQQASLLASLGEMTAGIAHEVNNPLSSILLYSELLMAGDVNPRMRKDLRLIHDEAERAARTMSELLNYARGIEVAVSRVNLNALARKVLQVRSYQHGVKNVRVIRHLSKTPVYVLGDSNQLTQVVMNLVLNAEDSLNEKKAAV